MVDSNEPLSRKSRRKLERASKKLARKRHRTSSLNDTTMNETTAPAAAAPSREKTDASAPAQKKKKKKTSHKKSKSSASSGYSHLDASTAAALARDDEEIAALEAKLGLSDNKKKAQLNKEYAKLEGYGDDFGDFLDDLDGMVQRVTTASSAATGHDEDDDDDDNGIEKEERGIKKVENKSKKKKKKVSRIVLDAETEAALQRDDEEIAALGAKLGIKDSKEKSRLYKEYAKLECYGDDFGEFLDGLDDMVERVVHGDDQSDDESAGESSAELARGSDSEDEDEEIVPMKGPNFDDLDEDDSVMADLEEEGEEEEEALRGPVGGRPEQESGSDSDSSDEDGDGSGEEQEPDHDAALTYRPTKGEDIYGNTISTANSTVKPQKYVPPHLRKKQQEASNNNAEDDEERQESLRSIQRSLNNSLNRLSEDTLVSVAQAIAKLYPLHPTSDVNECLWKNTKNACVARTHLATGLIPVYIAGLCGAHFIKGDGAQLGEYLMEKVVLDLWKEVKSGREKSHQETEALSDDDLVAKEASNLMLCLCYLYNFGVVHCSLMYEVVRAFIESFQSIDMELLLLILNHCGRALRSDDPSALKEIVLMVQKRALETKNQSRNTSHVEYMVQAIMDLKNNKRRNQNAAYVEKTNRLRKILGQIKSSVASSNGGFRSESSLRISLSDLLNAEEKGRFWKVGASWVGNQYRFQDGEDGTSKQGDKSSRSEQGSGAVADREEDSKLLKLATKYRMNTDVRRTIFCIIMGSADCDDAFEKLIRAEMLKNRTERETVRVLMECCGHEKSFNKYYSHLASRICEFQPQAKFSFQLAFWDAFKTFDDTTTRKAANLAKLLFHLVVVHFSLRLNVLKAIDMSSPEELPETAMIFVTIFLTSLLEHFDDPSDAVRLVETGISRRRTSEMPLDGEGEMSHMDDGDALRASLTVFLVQVMKSSPKYKKGSKFRANLKAVVKACDTDNFF